MTKFICPGQAGPVFRHDLRLGPCHNFLPGVLCVAQGHRITSYGSWHAYEKKTGLPTGMSHRTACGWSQVCIDSGPVALYLLQWPISNDENGCRHMCFFIRIFISQAVCPVATPQVAGFGWEAAQSRRRPVCRGWPRTTGLRRFCAAPRVYKPHQRKRPASEKTTSTPKCQR